MGCLLYPPGRLPETPALLSQTMEDLQLERLAGAMACSDYYRMSAAELCALFTDDPETLRWRQAVVRDILTFPGLEEALGRLMDSLDGWEGRTGGRRGGLDAFAVGFSLEDFSWLESYLKKVDAAWQELSAIPAESEGLHILLRLLDGMRNSPRFRDVSGDFRSLCAGHAAPARMRIGYNLDREMKPSRLKLLYMEGPGGEKKDKAASRRQMMLTQRAIETKSMLLQRLSMQAGQDINAFVMRETAPLRGLRRELTFCLSAAKLAHSWQSAGLPYCFPKILPAADKAFSAKGLFDPLLLLSGKEQVVSNDAELRRGGELAFLTGANQGGKTVFLLSLGLCQWLAQLGCPVPAEAAALSPAKNILTIFAPNGQQYGRKGLLAEEAGRIAEAVANLTGESLLLFNEPLTSTGPEETRSISAEVAAVCMAAGARGVWVTHVYELARDRTALEAAVPWGSRAGSLRVVLEEENGSPRFTYRVERGEPMGDSHAEDALRRGGVQFS